jgi:hypothetical protein
VDAALRKDMKPFMTQTALRRASVGSDDAPSCYIDVSRRLGIAAVDGQRGCSASMRRSEE